MKRCEVCNHPQLAEINAAMLEGVGTMGIAKEFGLGVDTVTHHRKSGHAGRALTATLLGAATGPLADLLRIELANKVTRVSKLQALMDKIERVIEERAGAYNHVPGGATGLVGVRRKMLGAGPLAQEIEECFFDTDLVGEYRATLEQIAKECGEWRPQGTSVADGPVGTSITVNHYAQAEPPPNSRTIEHPPQRPAKRLPNPPATPGILQQLSIDGSPEVSEVPSSDSCKSGKLDLGVLKGGVEVAGAARPGSAVEDSEGD